ncbi:hypothetical protein [Pantoea ananatis]|uniref:hypothetical protein n=1 Tax=Pantoea ananas TaxID=553 RepID=UPI000AB3ED32|nr:hypothetical protein [Pantoea ananatis]
MIDSLIIMQTGTVCEKGLVRYLNDKFSHCHNGMISFNIECCDKISDFNFSLFTSTSYDNVIVLRTGVGYSSINIECVALLSDESFSNRAPLMISKYPCTKLKDNLIREGIPARKQRCLEISHHFSLYYHLMDVFAPSKTNVVMLSLPLTPKQAIVFGPSNTDFGIEEDSQFHPSLDETLLFRAISISLVTI